jgi:hypothetical protein
MEQHVVARRIALLAGMGAVVFTNVQEIGERVDQLSTTEHVTGLLVGFVAQFAALATVYAALVFKGRLGVVCEVIGAAFVSLYVLLGVWGVTRAALTAFE